MPDVLRAAEEARKAVRDETRPLPLRVEGAIRAYEQWVDEGDGDLRDQLAVAGCNLPQEDQLQDLSESELEDLLNDIDAVTYSIMQREALHLIDELDAAEHRVPVEAIGRIREHRQWMIPQLIEVIEDRTAAARDGCVSPGNAHGVALVLLTEFEAREALPAILEAASLPGELCDQLFGMVGSEMILRTLAVLAGDEPEVIFGLAANRSLDASARWNAMTTFRYLIRDGKITREQAMGHLRQYLREAIEERDIELTTVIVTELCDYGPSEAAEELREAFRQELVEEFLICPSDVEEAIAHADTRFANLLGRSRRTAVDDTVAELKKWSTFRERPAASPEPESSGVPGDGIPAVPQKPLEPFRRPGPPVGRNDPCPCGSGKKFKKCCGARK